MRPFPVIRNFKQYFWKNLVPALLIVTGGIIFLNYFLAYRLENYLKQEVKSRVAEASDGFYSLTFDDLYINILNGELAIEGIHLQPDSGVFNEWQKKDSLPLTYVEASIDKIDFKGINLIWLRNYRKLNFTSFEINHPTVHVVDAFYSDRHKRSVRITPSKTLFEYIEPYIDILSVNDVNVESASASFLVENPFTPILYKIEDIDFFAQHFQLDSASSRNGNLLYCEHFEFISDQPQTILTNNHFLLKTDTILFNTRDSLILLKDIELIQRNLLHPDTSQNSPEVVSGEIPSIKVTGAAFKRINAFNTMRANSLEIDSSYIHLSIHQSSPSESPDSTNNSYPADSLSLYDFISPIIKRLEIESIAIKNTRLDYSRTTDKETDHIKIDNIDLSTSHFLIDSIYEEKYGLRYSNEIALQAKNIDTYLSSLNHQIKASLLLLDTKSGIFRVEDIYVSPISLKTQKASLNGEVSLLSLTGSEYKNGIKIKSFLLDSPNLTYYSPTTSKKSSINNSNSFFSPAMEYISVEDFLLKNATIGFHNRNKGEQWNVKGIESHLTNFYISQETLSSPEGPDFLCEKINLRVRDFDSYPVNGNYHLQLKNASYSNLSGLLDVKNIRLATSEKGSKNKSQPLMNVQIPQLQISGLREIWKTPEDISIDSVKIDYPVITVRESGWESPQKVEQKTKEYTPFQPFRTLDIKHIGLTDTHINYQSETNQQELKVNYDLLSIDNTQWNLAEQRELAINKFTISSPQVKWKSGATNTAPATDTIKPKTIPEILYPYAEKLTLHNLQVDDILLETEQPYITTDFKVTNFHLDSLVWIFKEEEKKMYMDNIEIITPVIHIAQQPAPVLTTSEKADTIKTSIYDQLRILGNEIGVHTIQVTDANLNFHQTISPNTEKEQQVNKTDFSLTGLQINNDKEKFAYEDIYFQSHDLSIPISQGFYTLDMERVELNNQDITIDKFHMNPAYDKKIFAYMHPRHKDWFDVTFDRLQIKDLDLNAWFNDSLLHIAEIQVDNPILQNFKNKQIYVAPKWMPMIYEGLQKAPFDIDVEKIQVNNFGVIYEELAKKGTEPGRLRFTELNGIITGFTNIVSYPEQYIRLDANGKFYGEGYFEAVWLLPVDSLNDHFILEAHLPDMDLTLLNEIIKPLASAQLKGGHVNDLTFRMDAGNIGGTIDMLLLYDGLKVDIFEKKNGQEKSKKFLNFLVNAVVRDNNPNQPNHPRSKPRQPSDTIIRDPYHSTFNYLWQLLRPPLIETVGISKTQQKIAGGIVKIISGVKKLFGKGKDKKPTVQNPEQESEAPLPG